MFGILFPVFKFFPQKYSINKRIETSMVPKDIAAKYQSNPFKQ